MQYPELLKLLQDKLEESGIHPHTFINTIYDSMGEMVESKYESATSDDWVLLEVLRELYNLT